MPRSTALLLVLVAAAVGCDGDGDEGGGGIGTGIETETGTATQTATMSGTGTKTDTSTGTNTFNPAGCWVESGFLPCYYCCEDNLASELDAFNEYADELCYCGADAPCVMECSDSCDNADAPFSMACRDCVQADPCAAEVREQCLVDPACAPFVDCYHGCF